MRTIKPIMIAAAALFVAGPALAQNEAAPTNTTDVTATNSAATTDLNAVGTTTVDTTAVPATTVEPLPVDANAGTIDTSLGAPAPAEKKHFPWGVIGILGLLGLIPRTRRS